MKNIALLFLLLFSQLYYTQSPILVIQGKVLDTSENIIANAEIKITFNDSTIIYKTNASGKYGKINLPMNEIYLLTVSCDTYISKSIIIDTKTDFDLADSSPITDVDLPLQLNSKKNLKKRKLSKKPYLVGKLKIDQKLGGLAIDYAFTSKQRVLYEEAYQKAMR